MIRIVHRATCVCPDRDPGPISANVNLEPSDPVPTHDEMGYRRGPEPLRPVPLIDAYAATTVNGR